ncbi:uncharacterized protein LOC143561731 [Bidens hawaiensis]|uniref:uncharacterized protein LOC143561731 n=1 Tax=Bidens hawaiensis TaxID=980011 RepID=UPI00404ADB21
MVFCECGKEAVIKTSWTDKNPGRGFYSCPVQGSNCKFIGWFDHKKCQRCMDIIPGLLRAKNSLEEANNSLEDAKNKLEEANKNLGYKASKMKKMLIASCICFIIYVPIVNFDYTFALH